MGITREELLQELSARYGGSILVDKRKVDLANSNVLFISLGGMGAKTLNAIKREVSERINPTKRIKYLAVDTDVSELKGVRSPNPGGLLTDEECIGLYEKFGAPNLENPPEHIARWLETSLIGTKLDDKGAKGVRQVGRAFLANPVAYNKIKSYISKLLMELTSDKDCAPKTSIFVVAGIAGGTGSGTVIDMAYLIRECMEGLVASSTGIFYLADVQEDEPFAVQKEEWKKLYKNCYAALKEIDYFYNIEQRGGEFRTVVSSDTDEPIYQNIFDDVILVSKYTNNGNGKTKVFNTAGEAIRATARAMAFMISEFNLVDKDGNKAMSLESGLSNEAEKILSDLLPNARSLKLPGWGMYRYSTISYSSLYIPRDELMAYCANILYEKVNEKWKQLNKVNENSIEDALKSVHMSDLKSLLEGVYQVVVDEKKFTPAPNKDVYPEKAKFGFGIKYVEETAQWAAEMTKRVCRDIPTKMQDGNSINQFVRPVFELIDEAFEDADKGPYYAINLLSSSPENGGVHGVLLRINNLKSNVAALKKHFNGAIDEINQEIIRQKAKLKGVRVSDDDIAAYGNLLKSLGKATCKAEMLKYIEDFIDAVYERLNKKNSDLYSIFTVLLETLPEILYKDSEYTTNSKRTKGESKEVFSFDIVNMEDGLPATKRFKDFFDNLVNNSDIDARSSDFINRVFVKLKKDFDTEGTEVASAKHVAEAVRGYFGEFFGELSRDTIEKLCVMAYYDPNLYGGKELTPSKLTELWENPDSRNELLASTAKSMKAVLDAKVTPYLATNSKMPANISDFPRFDFVGLLSETPALNSKFGFGQDAGVMTNGGNEIFHARLVVGIPLFVASMMEEAYNYYLNFAAADAGKTLNTAWLKEMPEPFGYAMAKQLNPYSDLPEYASEKEQISEIHQKLMGLRKWGLLRSGSEIVKMELPQEASQRVTKGMGSAQLKIVDSDQVYYLLGREISGNVDRTEYRAKVKEILINSIEPEKEQIDIYRILSDLYADFKRPKLFNRVMVAVHAVDFYNTATYAGTISCNGFEVPEELAYLVYTCPGLRKLLNQIEHSYRAYIDEAKKVRDEVLKPIEWRLWIHTFVEAIEYGIIRDDTDLMIWQYYKKDIKRPKNLFEYPHAQQFDREFALYHAFAAFYKMGVEERDAVESEIKSRRNADYEPMDSSVLLSAVNKVLKNTRYLGNAYESERMQEMGKGFRVSNKDGLKYDVPDGTGGIAAMIQNLETFYDTVEHELYYQNGEEDS